LQADASDDVLGQALLQALERSRFVWPRDEPDLFKSERYMQSYRDWQQDFMRRYGYKTKREAYKKMDWCEAERSEGKISIKPHKRDKPEYFRNLRPDRTVVIPATENAVRIGAALRLALDRCE
jgi:CDI immunity protein